MAAMPQGNPFYFPPEVNGLPPEEEQAVQLVTSYPAADLGRKSSTRWESQPECGFEIFLVMFYAIFPFLLTPSRTSCFHLRL